MILNSRFFLNSFCILIYAGLVWSGLHFYTKNAILLPVDEVCQEIILN